MERMDGSIVRATTHPPTHPPTQPPTQPVQEARRGRAGRRVPESECWRRWRTLPAPVCEMLRRRSSEKGDALEKKEEREGGVPRRDNAILLRVGMIRKRR